MTTPFHRKSRCFMQDFAARDPRSAHAHLRGKSARAMAYVLFDGVSRLVGRARHAPGDYRRLSRWLFVHRQPLQRGAQAIFSVGTAVSGIAAGIALYLATLS